MSTFDFIKENWILLLGMAIAAKLVWNKIISSKERDSASDAQEDNSEDEDSDEDLTECTNCGSKQNICDMYGCDECGQDICEDCIVMDLKNINVCKKCVDKAYPRETKTITKTVEKIVEKPVYINLTTGEPTAEIDEHEFD